jgi:ATP-dependent DNA helicase RecG
MGMSLSQDIRSLAGIGEKKAALYQKLNIFTVGELLMHLPRSYLDFRRATPLESCVPGEACLVRATIRSKSREQRIRRGLSIWKVQAFGDGFALQLVFFNTKYTVEALKEGQEYAFYGVMAGTLLRREMRAPTVVPPARLGTLMPVYSGTAGLSSSVIARDIARALEAAGKSVEDGLGLTLREKYGLWPLSKALAAIHRPTDESQVKKARERVVFEELLVFGASMRLLRENRLRQAAAAMQDRPLGAFWNALSFSPTNAQRAAVADIVGDLCSGRLMNRLLQGDVGSGKTLVAAAAAHFAFLNGYQTALMAPTELLAEQHARTLTGLLEPLGMRVCLLTGSLGAAARREANALLAQNEAHLAVGTHALLSQDTQFFNLGLVVTDEQHRFGVRQRAALGEKGETAHTLVMSATPIPRTLSLILYGDLDVSIKIGRAHV